MLTPAGPGAQPDTPHLHLVPPPRGSPLSATAEAVLVGLCLVLFLALAAWRAQGHTHPYYDDVGFLDLANQVKDRGGPLALLRDLYAGAWTEDNRNPLYVAVLSLVAGRDPGFHTRGRLLTLGLGVLALLLSWRVARRHAGRRPALVLLALLAVSETMIEYSSREACEPLLVALWVLSIGAMLDGLTTPRSWLWAGAWAGLAQLCKGSGIFLPACFALALLIHRGWPALRDKWAWAQGAAFLVVASPLLVRNARVYGSPLHHFNNQLLWIDRLADFSETYAPHAFARLPHGFHEYAANLDAQKLVWRLGMGFGETIVHTADAMSFVSHSTFSPLHIALLFPGLAGVIWAVRVLWRAGPSFARTFLLVQAGFTFAFFVFFNAAGGSSRYLLPMTITLGLVLAREWVSQADRLAQEAFSPMAAGPAPAGGQAAPESAQRANAGRLLPAWLLLPGWPRRVAALAGAAVALSFLTDPSPRALPSGFAGAQAWLVQHLQPGDNYAVDSRTQLEPEWLLPASNHMEIVSASWREQPIPTAELVAFFRERGVRYVVLDAASHKDAARRYFFFDQLSLESDGSLPLAPLPATLQVAYADPSIPRRWLILELSPAPDTPATSPATFQPPH